MPLTIIIDKIVEALDNHEHVMVLYLDLAKAFDTVDHTILLNKLSHYGIRGKALSWFENYLNERQQFVNYSKCAITMQECNMWCTTGIYYGTSIVFAVY